MSDHSPPSRAPRDIKNVDTFEITSGGFGVLSDEIRREPPADVAELELPDQAADEPPADLP